MKNKVWKRMIAMVLMSTMTLSLLAGCGGKEKADAGTTGEKKTESANTENEKTKVTFWTWTPTEGQFAEIKAAFEKNYPELEIEWWRTNELADYQKKIQVALAGGEGPDLFGVQVGTMLNEYARFCEPMDEIADQYIEGWRDAIQESALEQTKTKEGDLAAMPIITCGQQYMLYNRTLLEENGVTEVPKTYDELKAVCDQLKEKGLIPVAMGAKDIWHDVDFFVAVSQQFGAGKIYEAQDNKIAFTDQVFVDTMEAWKKLFTEGIFQEGALGTGTYPDARDNYFYSRKSPFFPTGSWHVSVVVPNEETQGTAIEKDELGMAFFPQMGISEPVATTGVDFAICINKNSQNKEAAAKFVEHMTMGEGQQLWINALQGAPVNKNISFTAEDEIENDTAKESIEFVMRKNSESQYNRKLLYAELENALGIAMQDVAAGKDIKDALQEVQKVSEEIER